MACASAMSPSPRREPDIVGLKPASVLPAGPPHGHRTRPRSARATARRRPQPPESLRFVVRAHLGPARSRGDLYVLIYWFRSYCSSARTSSPAWSMPESSSSMPRSSTTATARSRGQVDQSLSGGQDLILEIDWQGAAQVGAARCPSASRSSSCRRRGPSSSAVCAAGAPTPRRSSSGGCATPRRTWPTGANSTASSSTTISIGRSGELRGDRGWGAAARRRRSDGGAGEAGGRA